MHPSLYLDSTPDKPVMVMASTGETITFRQLEDRSNQGAQLFRSLGLNTGDHIAVFLENHPRFFEICWAAQRAGLYYTCISSRLTASEAAYIVGDCGARLFITSKAMRPVADELVDMMPGVERRLMLDEAPKGYESFEALRDAQPTTRIADETQGADMLYSSGTTGRPKGVKRQLSGEPIDADNPLGMMTRLLYGINQDTVYLSPAPSYHSAPLRWNNH